MAGRLPDVGLSDPVLTIVLVGIVAILAILLYRLAVLMRRPDFRRYRFGQHVYVRCREGHLFTTTWVPFVSLKAIRLGLARLQYCPVGRHVTLVTIVRDDDLTDSERQLADHFHDGGLP